MDCHSSWQGLTHMPTSELSDALNPHVVQPRSRSSNSYDLQPVIQPSPQYMPHRSELELAITEPPPPPSRVRAQPSAEGIHAVQELLRTLAATNEAQEIERMRRFAWEHEQEAKYTLRQAEMEKHILEMRQEITSLKGSLTATSTTVPALQFGGPSSVTGHQPSRTFPPASPAPLPPFIESSSHHLQSQQTYFGEAPNVHDTQGVRPDLMNVFAPPTPITPMSPTISGKPLTPSVPPNRRKRQTSELSSDDGEESSATESSTTTARRSVKRVTRHDTRCLTIHQAMRAHILRIMQIDADQDLPQSHVESVPLESHHPARFVWDKTTKQSTHNSRMKARVLADLKSNRRLYKHVPDKDFNKKTLDSTFDQAFVTFRQKFKAQTDAWSHRKKKEDSRARRSRRVSRKKIKLNNRAEARMRLKTFEHVTFDGALQIECMSSEESDYDDTSTSRSDVLRVRRVPWRSLRLQKFYSILDDEETLEKSRRPKRGSGKKERCLGLPKEGFFIPPKGVASWMISRRWINLNVEDHPDLPDALKNVVVDSSGFDWDFFPNLGEESGDEEAHEIQDKPVTSQNGRYKLNDASSTSSLHNALASG